jgi:thiol-disulfide isomerase/thioredoxin
MKSIILALALLILLSSGCSTTRPAVKAEPVGTNDSSPAQEVTPVNYSDQATWLLGFFNPRQLKSDPHSAWFYKGYDGYQPGHEALATLKELGTEGISIKIVMGTWCPDSRREVPHFMKILELWQFPEGMLTFIGVDNNKLSPVGDFEQLDIHRVPTFIIYKNNVEAGRIIENPVASLEQDMVNILRGMKNNK